MSIVVKGLNFVYNPKTPFEKHALNNVDLTIEDGDWLSIIGHTGSGKSTFIQHLNGLVRPTSGSIVVEGVDLTTKKVDYKKVRGLVGMVFQYPEQQLFAETVFADVAFGPTNLGLSKEVVQQRVEEALTLVGLSFEEVSKKSPFELSGGQKRRVAIAGVIAMRPRVLVLDEPTAGLDPRGKSEILDLIVKLKQTCSPTIVMINHDMDEVAKYSTKIAVFNEGQVKYVLTPQVLFEKTKELVDLNLDVPTFAKLRKILHDKGLDISSDCLSLEKMTAEIARVKKLGKGGGKNV